MGSKLSPHDMRLYRAVDEVLHYVWNPIGCARRSRTEPPCRLNNEPGVEADVLMVGFE